METGPAKVLSEAQGDFSVGTTCCGLGQVSERMPKLGNFSVLASARVPAFLSLEVMTFPKKVH